MKRIWKTVIVITCVIVSFTLMHNRTFAQEKDDYGILKITTTPAGADVYVDGERYIPKCTPCSIPLLEGSHEVQLVIKGYEDCHDTVQIEAGQETILEKNILPAFPEETARVITVTTEDDPEEDFNNTSVTYSDLSAMEHVSFRLALNAIQNDTTDCWYRIEFAEGVNHIEMVNHMLFFGRDNLIINGDKNRDGIPDVWISQSNWGLIFRPMNNLYIMGLKFGEPDDTDCAISIRPDDYGKGDVSYNNIYVLGCEFTNCDIIPFCGACKVYDSYGKVDFTNINACGNILVNSNMFCAYSGNVDNSVTDGMTYQANQLDTKSVLSVMCADCNTNYIYGGNNEASNGTSCELSVFETSDHNTIKNVLICGNSGGSTTFGTAVNGNSYNTISDVVVRNNYFERSFSLRACQPIGERNDGNTLIMKNNTLENISFSYNVFDFAKDNGSIWIRVLTFDPGDTRCDYILENNVDRNISFNNNLLLGNDIYVDAGAFNGAHPNNIEASIEYEVKSGYVVAKASLLCDDQNIVYTNVNNRIDGISFDANRKVKTYDPYAVWDDSPVHIHSSEYIDRTYATCDEYGHKEYYLCSECERYFTDWLCENEIIDIEAWLNTEGRIEKISHDFSKYVSNGDGTHKVVCVDCGAIQEGHDKDACSGGTATCTAKAKCSRCKAEYGSLKTHTNTTTTTKATLTANGKKVTKCSECGKSTTTTIYYPKTFTLSKTSCEYTGSQIKPTITITDSNGKTVAATNYTVTYGTNKAVGKGTVKVTFKGDYSGTKTVEFKITPKKTTIGTPAIASDGITVKWTANTSGTGYYIYRSVNGADYTKVKTITSNATVSWKDTEATTNGAKYQYKIYSYKTVDGTTYKSPASSVKTIYFLTKPTVSSAASASDGITVKWNKNSKATGYYIYRSVNGADYTKVKTITSNATVSWNDTGAKTNGTKYQYKIYAYKTVSDTTYKSAVSAVKTTYFVSRPTISSLTAGTKAFTVKWGKNSKATGYQIQYSTTSDFSSGNNTVTVTSASTVSKTVSSLTAKKKYYVRIRTYKTVSGTKYYSVWSTSKAITTK